MQYLFGRKEIVKYVVSFVQEEEAKRELQKMELLTQARTNAAVTAEKARHLEDTKELQIKVFAYIDYYNGLHQLFQFYILGPSEHFDS